jgi:hypothetical protein
VRSLVLLCFCLLFSKVSAETFDIALKSDKELRNLAALEIELGFEPNSYLIASDFSIDMPNVLFKTVDQSKSIIRVFFDARAAGQELPREIHILGKLSRVNYNGEINASLKSIKYISDFSKLIDPKHIKSSITVTAGADDERIPYMGISNARLLGPSERMFFNPMMIAVGDIETYGFSFDKSVDEVTINGQKARFVTDKIVAITTMIPSGITELSVELAVKVHGTELRKNLGSIKLIEMFQ